jgi:hypothetical protein
MKIGDYKKGVVLAVIGLNMVIAPVMAQESAYADLDACTTGEQRRLAFKGAAIGLFSGLGGALLTGNKDKAAKAALVGLAGGAAAGWATAYYTAFETCKKMNPGWITESSLVRDPTKSLAQVKKAHHYKAGDGVMVQLQDVAAPASVMPGEAIKIDTTYDLLTPTDAEAAVVFERKLFVTTEGTETEVVIPTQSRIERTVEAGRSVEKLSLPTSANAPAGTVYRVVMSASAAGKPPVSMSKNITVS